MNTEFESKVNELKRVAFSNRCEISGKMVTQQIVDFDLEGTLRNSEGYFIHLRFTREINEKDFSSLQTVEINFEEQWCGIYLENQKTSYHDFSINNGVITFPFESILNGTLIGLTDKIVYKAFEVYKYYVAVKKNLLCVYRDYLSIGLDQETEKTLSEKDKNLICDLCMKISFSSIGFSIFTADIVIHWYLKHFFDVDREILFGVAQSDIDEVREFYSEKHLERHFKALRSFVEAEAKNE